MNPEPTTFHTETARRPEGRFYIGMSLAALAIALAGFGPAAMGSGRREPITLAVAAHGLVFLAWLALFITQTVLISNRQLGMHRRLGYAGVVLAMLMVVSGYATAVAMARRGYDLSGDLIRGAGDPLELLVFQLGDLVSFSLLVGLAVWYRRELQVHKRLMLFATVGALLPAALTHIIGHSAVLREIKAPIILVPLAVLLFAGAVHDRLSQGRIHPVSLWVAVSMFIWANVRAAVIGPSKAWHEFAGWLIQ